jgi:integrase
MAQSKREQYESTRDHVRDLSDRCKRVHGHLEATADRHNLSRDELLERAERGLLRPEDATDILEWCDGYDGEKATVTPTDADHETNRWGTTRSPTTLRQWLLSATAFACDLDGSLLEASTDELNQVAQRMYEGTAVSVTKPLSKNSVRSRQNCIKKFLRHADANADPDGIAVFDKQSTVVDPEDMLTRDEFHAIRNAPEHPRDKAIVDLFLYTGQRNTALRTLRIKDVDLDDGKYRLNTEADGLKGADLIGTWNPLLASVGSIRDWLNHHPDPENPDAYLLTERRDSLFRDATSTISDDTVNRVLREAAEKAAEEEPGIKHKPTHAHAMRHNFVTMCKRDYELDDDVIKRLIRHKPESDVMNTTYAHLSDSDYIQKAEEAFGLREEEDESPMTPEHCDVCREPLPPTAKACPNCGTVYTPDARSAEKQVNEGMKENYRDANPSDADVMEKIDLLDEILEDPQIKEHLLERMENDE